MNPLCIDLYCGLGGWAEGFLSEGWDVVGFDIERHDYGPIMSEGGRQIRPGGYPAQLVLQDVLTLHGSQFRSAAVIVASPPCQAYSYRAMPWKRAKALPPPDNTLFEVCFRIQREASAAAGRHIPLVVENVRGAQPWIGCARWHYGSFYLWGDVPAIMPQSLTLRMKYQCSAARLWKDRDIPRLNQGHAPLAEQGGLKGDGGTWFGVSHGKQYDWREQNPRDAAHIRDGLKRIGTGTKGDGAPHGSSGSDGNPVSKRRGRDLPKMSEGFRRCEFCKYEFDEALGRYGCPNCNGEGLDTKPGEGIKQHGSDAAWFDSGLCRVSSRSIARKAASAQIAKIPFELSSYIARIYRP